MLVTNLMWSFKYKLIKNSVPELHYPYFKCLIAICGKELFYGTAENYRMCPTSQHFLQDRRETTEHFCPHTMFYRTGQNQRTFHCAADSTSRCCSRHLSLLLMCYKYLPTFMACPLVLLMNECFEFNQSCHFWLGLFVSLEISSYPKVVRLFFNAFGTSSPVDCPLSQPCGNSLFLHRCMLITCHKRSVCICVTTFPLFNPFQCPFHFCYSIITTRAQIGAICPLSLMDILQSLFECSVASRELMTPFFFFF